jgi:hypothetical protein
MRPGSRIHPAALTNPTHADPSFGSGAGGRATVSKLCRAIRAEHVRALFTTPVAPIQLGGSSDCAFFSRGGTPFGAGVQVFLRIDDGDQTLWKHRGDHPYGKFRFARGRLPSTRFDLCEDVFAARR